MCCALATHLSFWRALAWSGLLVSNPSVLCRDSWLPTGSLLSLWRSWLYSSSKLDESLYLCHYLFNCFLFLLTIAWLSESVDKCVLWGIWCVCHVLWCCPVITTPWTVGPLIPITKGRIRPLTLISFMQKPPVIFHCNATMLVILDLKLPLFFCCPVMYGLRCGWSLSGMLQHTAQKRERVWEKEKKQFWRIFFRVALRQLNTAEQQCHEVTGT